MDDQILIGILRRLRWLEAHAVHYRIAEDGTAVLTWRGARSELGTGVGGGAVYPYPNDTWLASADADDRFWFTTDSHTHVKAPNGKVILRAGSDADQLRIGPASALELPDAAAGITFGGDVVLRRGGADQLSTDDQFTVGTSIWMDVSGAAHALYFGSAADTALYRGGANILQSPGTLWMGNGIWMDYSGGGNQLLFGAAADTNLYRSAANQLKTDDVFVAGGGAYVGASLYFGTGDANYDVSLARINPDQLGTPDNMVIGGFCWVDSSGTGAPIYFGSSFDVNLYRSAANTLKTDDNFVSAFSVTAGNELGVTNSTYLDTGGTGAKLYFGAAVDTNLYRSAANTLQTDDAFHAAMSISSSSNITSNIAGNRIDLWSDGKIYFGSAGDTNLYRSGANSLATDDDFFAGGSVYSGATLLVKTDDTRIPTQGENDAGAGSAGTPSSTNRYVTMDDGVWDVFALAPGTSDIAHDATSNHAGGTGDMSWTHTPVGTPYAVLVQVVQNVGITDEVVSVTYGGVTMQRLHEVYPISTGAEPGAIYSYTLTHDIPTGAQTVLVDVNGTASSKRAVAYTMTSGKQVYPTLLIGARDTSGSANPTATLALPTACESAVYGVLHSGLDAVSSIAAGANYTEVLEHDFGTQCASWIRSTANTTGGDTAVNWTATSETWMVVGVAFSQVQPRDWGVVSKLPSRPKLADRLQWEFPSASSTAGITSVSPKILNEYIYDVNPADATAASWRKIGGPEISVNDMNATSSLSSTSYTALDTPPSYVWPAVTALCEIRHGYSSVSNGGATCYAYQNPYVGGVQMGSNEQLNYCLTGGGYHAASFEGSYITVTSGQTIDLRNKVSTGNALIQNRWMKINPITLGP